MRARTVVEVETPDELTVTVVLTPGSVPVSGSIRIAQDVRPFTGWMDLVQRLEEARTSADEATRR